MGGLLHMVQQGGAWAGCGPAQSPPCYTKCNSPPINSQCTNFILFNVAMYGCETWTTTKCLLSRLDAFDTWALRKIFRIPYTRHVSNAEVRRTTGCSPLSHLVTNRRLRLFGHIACSSPCEDHYRAKGSVYPTSTARLEDLATLGSVQLRQTLALWTLALRLPGERPLLETNGDILWTQQRSSGVHSERRSVVWSLLVFI